MAIRKVFTLKLKDHFDWHKLTCYRNCTPNKILRYQPQL